MGFNEQASAAQDFSETTSVFGEAFTYSGIPLIGVFNEVQLTYTFSDFSTKKIAALQLVTSKAQWVAAGLTPANGNEITYGGVVYQIQDIAGADTAAECAYTITFQHNT